MKFAIILLIVLALACTAGSLIPQEQTAETYMQAYSKTAAGAILFLGLDDLFHAPWFLLLTAFLCLNLLGCNVIRAPRLLKRMREGFLPEKRLAGAGEQTALVQTREDPAELFRSLGFRDVQTVTDGSGRDARYAVQNRAGIWGAWVTHLGLLIVIVAFGLGQALQEEYTVYGVAGQTKEIGDTGMRLRINNFTVALREDDTVDQYTSDVTLIGADGSEESFQTTVNGPGSAKGFKFYQNSTGWAATVTVYKDGKQVNEDVLCAGEYILTGDDSGVALIFSAFYPDYVKGADGMPMTASGALRNPGYLYRLYYHDQMLGMNVLTGDETVKVEPYEFVFRDPQSYTLLQVKRDPFQGLALLGGLILMAGLLLAFYLHPKEVWAVKADDGTWQVNGACAKAGALFTEEIVEKADALLKKADSATGAG